MNSSEASRDARDVDLLDQHHARELYSNRPLPQAVLTNQLPAIVPAPSNNNRVMEFYSSLTQRVRGARLAGRLAERASGPQKENQCLEN